MCKATAILTCLLSSLVLAACTAGFPDIEQRYQACLGRAQLEQTEAKQEFHMLRCDNWREGALNRQIAAIDSVQIPQAQPIYFTPKAW